MRCQPVVRVIRWLAINHCIQDVRHVIWIWLWGQRRDRCVCDCCRGISCTYKDISLRVSGFLVVYEMGPDVAREFEGGPVTLGVF